MPGQPAAFMSYSRFDNENDNEFLTRFRDRLSREVRAQWGHDFKIFQDIADIGWGSDWQATLDEALKSAAFLIPIITPNFFESDTCRAEVEKFIQYEQALHRGGHILPLYYIDTPQFEEYKRYKQDLIVSALHGRQYADWRDLRHELINDIVVGRKISDLARQITAIIRASSSGEERGVSRTDPSGKNTAGILRAVPSPEGTAGPWPDLLEVLKQNRFKPAEWQLFSVQTREIRRILSQDFPPYPVRAAEISSVIDALAHVLDAAAVRNTPLSQVSSACETAERKYSEVP